jgi:YHS domain-containing protein
MKHVIVIFVLLFSAFLSLSSFAQDKKMEMKKKVEGTETKVMDTKQEVEKTKVVVDPNKPVNTICPVSGEEIDPEITVKYKDKTYAVCCKSCLKKFNKDPEKYISKLSEDGKSFKKIKQQ